MISLQNTRIRFFKTGGYYSEEFGYKQEKNNYSSRFFKGDVEYSLVKNNALGFRGDFFYRRKKSDFDTISLIDFFNRMAI